MAQPQVDLAERIKIIGQRIREGRDTYAGRMDAWHLMGIVTGEFQRWRDLYTEAKQDFSVIKMQLEFQGQPIEAWGTFRIDLTQPDKFTPTKQNALPDGRDYWLTFLGTVGKDYNPIQHTDGFELLDRLVNEVDGAHYETMGVLDFGRLIWAQVDPNVKIRVGKDDVSEVFLTFTTSHDGSKAFDIYETGTRMVCRNTFRIGSLKRLGSTLRVRHTKNAQQRIQSLSAEIAEIHKVAENMQEKLAYLASRHTTRESVTSIMARLFPMTTNDDGVEESSSRRDNILASVLARYEYNDGDTFPEQRGSLYNLWNAVTAWVDHDRSSKGDGRAEAAVFGSGAKLKHDALELILAEAESAPCMRGSEQGVVVDFASVGLDVPALKSN